MDYKGIKVISTPWYLKWSPWYRFFKASADYPHITLREDVYQDLTSGHSDDQTIAIMEHEAKHIERIGKMGKFKFNLKYKLFPKFRLQEELEADRARIKYLKKKNLKFDFDARAKQLSSWGYIFMVSYKDAKKALEKIWQEA